MRVFMSSHLKNIRAGAVAELGRVAPVATLFRRELDLAAACAWSASCGDAQNRRAPPEGRLGVP